MILKRYTSAEEFGNDVLEILMENEVQNNLPISFIRNERGYDTSGWLMAAVKDDSGSIRLIAACTPPFNIVLYKTGNQPDEAAVSFLAAKLREIDFSVPGVLAESSLAHRFAAQYAGVGNYQVHMSMNVMRLDKAAGFNKAPGKSRFLQENDLSFTPYWERAFAEECDVERFSIAEHAEKIRNRIGKDTHLIWEDGRPVSQAAHCRST